ncbi:hypothetical protein BLD44_007910 [Mastigocladus laminosus UU774]|nr:hypothetical protein BLD44_007910 [Mastigocladus laminosus UU774]
MAEQSDIRQTIESAGYAATSATGSAVINIINYYYREYAKVAPVKSDEVSTDKELPCPYRGLFHFGPNDAEFFFGREVFIKELFQATQTRNFIAVLGASGSGKSSVVLAGLVPRLQQEGHWQFTHFRPGSDPFHALALSLVPLYTPELNATEQIRQARQLAGYFRDDIVPVSDVFATIQQNHPKQRLLVIADQFEELYTQCREQAVRHRFLDCILASIQSLTSGSLFSTVLVATIRADFLGSALSYRSFVDVLTNTDIKLGPMNREELSQVIEKPAEKLGVNFEVGLVERILDDVENEPGNLPLLEFALTLLWQRRRANQLTHTAYDAIGQVKGALVNYADEKYDNLTSAEQEQARRIFIQLVRPGEDTEDTRRLATSAELGEENWYLVTHKDGLADSRLVVTSRNAAGQEIVEIVHEALIQNWGKLRQWIETDRKFRAWQERLRIRIQEWEAADKDDELLLRGVSLLEADDWREKRLADLSLKERFFIQLSLALRDREKAERERVKIEKSRLQRRAIAWLSGGLIVASIAAGAATWQWHQANQQRQVALVQLLATQAEQFRTQNPALLQRSVLVALEAMKRGSKVPPNSRSLLSNQVLDYGLTLLASPVKSMRHGEKVWKVAFSPNGKYLATVSGKTSPEGLPQSSTVFIWEISRSQLVAQIKYQGAVTDIAFSPDGRYLATAGSDGTARLWDSKSGGEITRLKHKESVNRVTFSPDGTYLATTSNDTARVWEVASKLVVKRMTHQGVVVNVVFSPDGQYLATAGQEEGIDGTVRVWKMGEEKEIRRWRTTHRLITEDLAFSPKGQYVAVQDERSTRIWEVSSGQEAFQITPLTVGGLAFSSDEKYLAATYEENAIGVWDIAKGQEFKRLPLKKWGALGLQFSNNIAFSPNGKYLVAYAVENMAQVWEVSSGREIARLIHNAPLNAAVFSSDGNYVATASDDGTAQVWKTLNDYQARKITFDPLSEPEGYYPNFTFSPDGKYLTAIKGIYTSTLPFESLIRVWEAKSGQEVQRIAEEEIVSVTISLNGKYLAILNQGGIVQVLKAANGREIMRLQNSSLDTSLVNVPVLSFSPDGEYLATVSKEQSVEVWKVTSGQKIVHLRQGTPVWDIGFSFDGKYLGIKSGHHTDPEKEVIRTINVWEVENVRQVAQLPYQEDKGSWFIGSFSFTQKGKYLATVRRQVLGVKPGSKLTVQVWEVASGHQVALQTYEDVTSIPDIFSFSPDGKYLAMAVENKTTIVLDLVSGREIARVPFDGQILTFSQNGKYLAAVNLDYTVGNATVSVWDITSKKEIARLKREYELDKILFSPDSRFLAILSQNGIEILALQPQELITEVCRHLTRNLSQEEWKQYLLNEPYRKTCPNLP